MLGEFDPYKKRWPRFNLSDRALRAFVEAEQQRESDRLGIAGDIGITALGATDGQPENIILLPSLYLVPGLGC